MDKKQKERIKKLQTLLKTSRESMEALGDQFVDIGAFCAMNGMLGEVVMCKKLYERAHRIASELDMYFVAYDKFIKEEYGKNN